MQRNTGPGSAMSEVVSITLILLLLVVIALVVYVVVFGQAHLAPKSAYISARGTNVNLSLGPGSYLNTIALFHFEGDAVNLNRSRSGDGMAPVGFNLLTPSGEMPAVRVSSLIADNTWNSGDTITIYEDASGYWVTDNITRRIEGTGTLGPLVDMPGGNYTVNIVDLQADLLVAAIPVSISGSAVTRYSPGLIATYYRDETWSSEVAKNIASRIRFADASGSSSYGYASDVTNWPSGYAGQTEHFSVTFDGFIKIETEDDYTFYLTSDDGSTLEIDGATVVNNGGLHAPQMRQGTIHLAPGYHPITVNMFERTGSAVVYLEESTPTVARAISTRLYHIPSTAPMADFVGIPNAGPADLKVQFTDRSIDATSWSWNFGDGPGVSYAKNPVHTYKTNGRYSVTLVASNTLGSTSVTKDDYITVGSFSPGFSASYYRGQTWSDLANSRIDSSIQFSDQGVSTWPSDMVGRQNDFSVTWDGYLYVPSADTYTFYLNSDDGSFMDLDGTANFINNGGDHSAREYTESVTLSEGYHHVVVRMYENGGTALAHLRFTNATVTSPQYVTNVWHI